MRFNALFIPLLLLFFVFYFIYPSFFFLIQILPAFILFPSVFPRYSFFHVFNPLISFPLFIFHSSFSRSFFFFLKRLKKYILKECRMKTWRYLRRHRKLSRGGTNPDADIISSCCVTARILRHVQKTRRAIICFGFFFSSPFHVNGRFSLRTDEKSDVFWKSDVTTVSVLAGARVRVRDTDSRAALPLTITTEIDLLLQDLEDRLRDVGILMCIY